MDIMDHFTCEVSVVYSSVARQELLQELCDELVGTSALRWLKHRCNCGSISDVRDIITHSRVFSLQRLGKTNEAAASAPVPAAPGNA